MSPRQVIFFNPSRRPHGKVLAPRPEFAQRLDPSDSVHVHPWHPELDSFFLTLVRSTLTLSADPHKKPKQKPNKFRPPDNLFVCVRAPGLPPGIIWDERRKKTSQAFKLGCYGSLTTTSPARCSG
jgi:hypothetical protein